MCDGVQADCTGLLPTQGSAAWEGSEAKAETGDLPSPSWRTQPIRSAHGQAARSEPRPPPGPSGRRGPGCALLAAPGASAKLCAALLRPGGQPALPPVRGDLLDRALHLPARHRGGLHSDRRDQNRQVGRRGRVWVCVCVGRGAVVLSILAPLVLSHLSHTPQLSLCWQSPEACGRRVRCLESRRAWSVAASPGARGGTQRGERGVFSHRRSIHSQEMLGQLLKEVCMGPGRAQLTLLWGLLVPCVLIPLPSSSQRPP